MTNKSDEPGEVTVTFIDNPHAPEIYADDASGIGYFQGNVRLTFESARIDHERTPGPINRVVIARLTMSLTGAQRLRNLLNDYLGKIENQTIPQQMRGTSTLQ